MRIQLNGYDQNRVGVSVFLSREKSLKENSEVKYDSTAFEYGVMKKTTFLKWIQD